MGLNSGQVLLDQFYPQAAEAISHLGHGHSHSHGIDIHGPSIHAAWLAAGSIVVKEWLYHASEYLGVALRSYPRANGYCVM